MPVRTLPQYETSDAVEHGLLKLLINHKVYENATLLHKGWPTHGPTPVSQNQMLHEINVNLNSNLFS